MSWMSPLDAEREKLEGVPLTLCTDCKDMVVQVNNYKADAISFTGQS